MGNTNSATENNLQPILDNIRRNKICENATSFVIDIKDIFINTAIDKNNDITINFDTFPLARRGIFKDVQNSNYNPGPDEIPEAVGIKNDNDNFLSRITMKDDGSIITGFTPVRTLALDLLGTYPYTETIDLNSINCNLKECTCIYRDSEEQIKVLIPQNMRAASKLG